MPKPVLPVLEATEPPEPAGPLIHRAAKLGDVDGIKKLLEADISCVNEQDESGYTALQWASLYNHVDVMRLLLAAGAKVNITDRFG